MLSDTIKVQDTSDKPETGSGGSVPKPKSEKDNKPADKKDDQLKKESTNEVSTTPAKNDFPPPKTDKPRPHVCGTCNRSFARLEHLKRHERSHTKEKPFECPECTRCFARRDLLLRHQQKLHLTTTPSSRPRGRRESTSSSAAGVGKARKGSMVQQSNPASMRPRANTISHVDGATLGFLAAANSSVRHPQVNHGHSTYPSLNGFGLKPAPASIQRPHGLPKIDTNGLNLDIGGGLRTAPAFGGFSADMDMSSFLYGGGNTVNPAQLHFADSPQSMAFDPPLSPFQQTFGQGSAIEEDPSFEWINGFNSSMTFDSNNEHAVAGSSPSAISTGSPGAGSELMLDSSQHQSQDMWQHSLRNQNPMISDIAMDMNGSSFADILGDPLSPKAMDFGLNDAQFNSSNAFNMNTNFNNISNPLFSVRPQTDSPLTAPSISGSSNRQSSVTSAAAETITEGTRNALIAALSQPGPFGHRKYSQPTISSPLSPGFSKSRNGTSANLPSTPDFQRYVAAYLKYFHPRLPFLHLPTLSFEPPVYNNHARIPSLNRHNYSASGAGDGGCLILSMAAIGALFEFDYTVSRELFEAAKKLIQIFLEERRRADMSAAINLATNSTESAASNTPLWLVQSMLLNVVYGHNCGDRTSADIASTHCAALVSLARAAGLARSTEFPDGSCDDINMADDGWNPQQNPSDESTWYIWKTGEEKKRTLYSIFVLSSMLVSSYNFPPSLTNSEIRLDLPCDEDLWAADSAAAWNALGGSMNARSKAVSFAGALSSLLTASQRIPFQQHQISANSRPEDDRLSSPNLPNPEFHASEFGCLVLIIALHNYIWETRQRHLGRQWTHQETEAMQAHIGPALIAYQAVWREPPHHNVQRPNPYGASDLSADCVPWLDLAYVRLFVALGRSKECFWHRDWDGMAHEIARGCEIVQHAEELGDQRNSPLTKIPESHATDMGMEDFGGGQTTKRERHLRKAASHAAHSLVLADKFNVSLADFPTREMSIGSAMCANDCAQVVSEWVSTVQERVGPYMGIIGRDSIDFEGVPAIMLLEAEDISLLGKIEHFVNSTETKLAGQTQNPATHPLDDNGSTNLQDVTNAGLACKLLSVTARMCESGGTWSVMHLMARSLESQAEFMKLRAERSLTKSVEGTVEG